MADPMSSVLWQDVNYSTRWVLDPKDTLRFMVGLSTHFDNYKYTLQGYIEIKQRFGFNPHNRFDHTWSITAMYICKRVY